MTKITVMTISATFEELLKDQEQRYRQATARLEAEGIPFTDLVDSCCRNCASYEGLFKISDAGLGAWTFIGQESKYKWIDGYLYEGEPRWETADEDLEPIAGIENDEPTSIFYSFAEAIHIYFEDSDCASTVVPAKIVKAFQDAGFEVKWSGTSTKAPQLVFFS